MKKVLSILLLVLALSTVLLLASCVTDNTITPSEGLEFELNEDQQSYYVKGLGTHSGAYVVIPAEYNGLPVTKIGSHAFSSCISLASITIPDSVTSIGGHAFAHCASLVSITIPNSVTEIESWAFHGCSSLTSVTLSNSLTTIGYELFSECTSLTNIIIPRSIVSIDSRAFTDCTSLTSVIIPDSVTSIGDSVFRHCLSLTSINYTGAVEQWNKYNGHEYWRGPEWSEGYCVATIICTDGQIDKDGTITYYK